MELQLGLALPSNPIKELGLDLNSYVYEFKEVLGLDLLTHRSCFVTIANNNIHESSNNKKKRGFDEAFQQNNTVPLTLPLLLWNNQPNENDDDPKDLENNSFNKNDRDGDSLVGWPPINSSRKKLCYQSHGIQVQNNRTVLENGCVGNGGGGGGRSNSKYVKVKMEGMAIARKVDLSLHDSYQTLTDTLMHMFGKCHEQSSNGYKITYQDNEGDWLLAADVPWRTFIRSVRRLKLMKICG